MKTLKEIFILELRRLANKKNIGLFLFLSLVFLYFLQIGIGNFKSIDRNKDDFLDIERLKVQQYVTYGQYGTYGFRVMFIPSPLSIYFVNSSTISELTSNVDSGERLNVYNSFKGKTLFSEKSGGFKDFSGIMLLLGSLLVLFFGYEALVHKDYLRFMSGFIGCKKLYFFIILSRVFVFILFLLFHVGISLVLLKLYGIELLKNDYIHLAIFAAILFLVLLFFFILGTIAGSFKSRFAGFVLVIITWFFSVFLIPGVVSAVTSRKADNLESNYRLELQKLKTLMSFEKRALEKQKNLKKRNRELERELIESYWNKEVKEFQASEKKLKKEMEKNIRLFQKLSFLFPSTYYLSTSNEISSKGYENYIDFFDYIQKLKIGFVRFYINKRFYSNYSEVEPFTKNRENLFAAESRLPGNFNLGLVLTLVYIAVSIAVSYSCFKKSLKK